MKASLHTRLGNLAMPVARAWIRHAPTSIGKSWLWERFHWRKRDFACRTRFGAQVVGSTQDLIQRYLYYFGVWEPDITHWIASTLAPGDVFIDIGANIGYYSLLAARIVGSSGRVAAIEASPAIYRLLTRHVMLNHCDNVRTILGAASERTGVMRVVSGGPGNIGSTHVVTDTLAPKSADAIGSRDESTVAAAPLCEILREDEIARARIIKIDVEGAEVSVVRGLVPALERLRTDVEILVEISPALMTRSSDSAAEIFAIFERYGFGAFILANDYSAGSYLTGGAAKPPVAWRGDPASFGKADVLFSRDRSYGRQA